MKKLSIVVMFLFCICVASIPQAVAQSEPQFRSLTMESMENTEFGLIEPIPCLELTFTFALSSVDQWGDQCFFLVWKGKSTPIEVGGWAIGFSDSSPPSLQALYGDLGFIGSMVNTAEFPYGSAVVEGTLYYYYRIHIYVDSDVVAHETLYFGGAYMIQPTMEGSSLVRLKVNKVIDDVAIFKQKVMHDA